MRYRRAGINPPCRISSRPATPIFDRDDPFIGMEDSLTHYRHFSRMVAKAAGNFPPFRSRNSPTQSPPLWQRNYPFEVSPAIIGTTAMTRVGFKIGRASSRGKG